MQELFFLAGWVEMEHFVTEKEHNCQNNKNIASLHLKTKEKKPNLSELTQVFCGPLSLLSKYF